MRRYAILRIVEMIPTMVGISIVMFLLLAMAPGDPLSAMLVGNPAIDPATVARLREAYGLDAPLHIRYLRWLVRALQGDMGWSLSFQTPVAALITARLPNTLLLAASGLVVAIAVGIPVGIYAAVQRYSLFDYVTSFFTFMGFSIPLFWMGLMLIYVFGIWLGWVPPGGIRTVGVEAGWPAFWDRVRYLILPALVIAAYNLPTIVRYTRMSMLDVLSQDYIRTARGKGLKEARVRTQHAFRNAMLPIVTVLALLFPLLFGGAPVTEAVFSWPGMGDLLVTAVISGDLVVAQAVLLLFALAVIGFNFLADLAYGILDPRVRYE